MNEPTHESALDRALRIAAGMGNEQHEARYGLDPDFLIQDAINTVLKQTYPPFDRSLKLWMDDVEIFHADGAATGPRTIPAHIRKELQMIGTTIVSWNVQGFGGKQELLDKAKGHIAENFIQASKAFEGMPNMMPPIDEATAKELAERLEAGMRIKLETMRARAQEAAAASRT